MMSWSENTWKQNKDTYTQILDLPFIKGLIDGTLSKERFNFYIQQDAIYLAEFGKVLAGIASKLKQAIDSEAFYKFACDTMIVEQSLHSTFLKEKAEQASPSCLLYTSYLHKQLNQAPIEISLAAVLPCFWIYREVGDYILANQTSSDNPYQVWIDTYGGEEFAGAVNQAIQICDKYAENSTKFQQEQMTEAFLMASKMEWLFWNSAWNLEAWKA
ncbi:thiaminase II [Ancylomarina sp. YFZ004]